MLAEERLGPDEVDADAEAAAGENRAPDFRLRGLVGAHGVESDVNEHAVSKAETDSPGMKPHQKERSDSTA
jgi:hypothetical protein